VSKIRNAENKLLACYAITLEILFRQRGQPALPCQPSLARGNTYYLLLKFW